MAPRLARTRILVQSAETFQGLADLVDAVRAIRSRQTLEGHLDDLECLAEFLQGVARQASRGTHVNRAVLDQSGLLDLLTKHGEEVIELLDVHRLTPEDFEALRRIGQSQSRGGASSHRQGGEAGRCMAPGPQPRRARLFRLHMEWSVDKAGRGTD